MRDLFHFDSMLTPKIITFVYWLLLLFVVVSGFGTMFSGFGGPSFGSFMMGLGTMIGGAIFARIWCELLIVLFKIHENMKKVAESQP